MQPPEAHPATLPPTTLTSAQQRFLDTFGFLRLPGLLAAQMPAIHASFERLVGEAPCDQILERDPALTQLLADSPLSPVLATHLGTDWQYLGSSGVRVPGTPAPWHCDSFVRTPGFLRVLVYLDAHTAETGCLHVVPGSHRVELTSDAVTQAGEPRDACAAWGVDMTAVPSVPLPVVPGDVILFDINLLHANFGQQIPRRLLNFTACAPPTTPSQLEAARMIAELSLDYAKGQLLIPAFAATASAAVQSRLTASRSLQAHLDAVRQGTTTLRHPRLRRQREAARAAPAVGAGA